jgi:CPA1 family monovalent cation:H+ antiporter
MTQTLFEIAAGLLAVTALASWFNASILKLPVAVGLMVVGLLIVAVVTAVDFIQPGLGVGETFGGLLGHVDYPSLVLNFLLAYLLFAGAMNVDLAALARRGVAVAVLATLGTVITAGLIAAGFWGVAQLVGYDLSPVWALVFGVLISPTDPIAVLAMTKRTDLDAEVRAQLEGEALFNDGVAVVLFRAALALAIAQTGGGEGHMDALSLGKHVAVEALGGAFVGAVGGLLTVLMLKATRDWMTEALITITCATAVYAAALHFELSGPIGVVVAGLVVGSTWGERSMSDEAKHYIHPFWHMTDEVMNAVLFLLAGLLVFNLKIGPDFPWALLIAAPVLVLVARWIAIAVPTALLPVTGQKGSLSLINVLTWAGVRGGLSLAMALSIPDGPHKQAILAGTFGVVIFSMLVQSMTMEGLAIRTGYGTPRAKAEPIH